MSPTVSRNVSLKRPFENFNDTWTSSAVQFGFRGFQASFPGILVRASQINFFFFFFFFFWIPGRRTLSIRADYISFLKKHIACDLTAATLTVTIKFAASASEKLHSFCRTRAIPTLTNAMPSRSQQVARSNAPKISHRFIAQNFVRRDLTILHFVLFSPTSRQPAINCSSEPQRPSLLQCPSSNPLTSTLTSSASYCNTHFEAFHHVQSVRRAPKLTIAIPSHVSVLNKFYSLLSLSPSTVTETCLQNFLKDCHHLLSTTPSFPAPTVPKISPPLLAPSTLVNPFRST